MIKISINYSKCIETTEKLCVELCPVSIFRDEESDKPTVINEEKCIMCRICEVNCPGGAIEILAI